jgi:hypothetical protein
VELVYLLRPRAGLWQPLGLLADLQGVRRAVVDGDLGAVLHDDPVAVFALQLGAELLGAAAPDAGGMWTGIAGVAALRGADKALGDDRLLDVQGRAEGRGVLRGVGHAGE